MATKILVSLVVVAAVVTAVPLNREFKESAEIDESFSSEYQQDEAVSQNLCAMECNNNPTKFNYQRSKTYVYEYKAETETSVAGASEDKARLMIETLANIEAVTECEFELSLQNVRVHHSEPFSDQLKPAEQMQEFQQALTAQQLRFSFDDGVIRSVCHSSQDEPWVLNFKKGLLSAFQNSMDDLTQSQNVNEVDVSGECLAEYNKSAEWFWDKSIQLTKSKNLQACSKNSAINSIIPMVAYNVPSPIQSVPIVKSSHQCKFTISSSKVLQSASCEESHVFAPFSSHQSGASTKVRQMLTLKTVKDGFKASLGHFKIRENLMFKHHSGNPGVSKSREAAEQKLKELCDQTKDSIRPETPRLFAELAQIVKALDANDLKSLLSMIKHRKLCVQNEKAKKFLLDTLPIAGTSAAVKVMVRIINTDRDVAEWEKQLWLTSLSLITKPTEDMLPPLKKLLSGKYGEQSLLPVSALLHTLCTKTVNCDRSYAFKNIVKKINDNIERNCMPDRKSQTMRTLRAIGNIGFGKEFLRKLKTCLTSSRSPLEHKVAAANAYRRFQCQDDEEIGPLFETFESKEADPELRMVAFLSIMRCPRDSVLQKIAAQLNQEEDSNVATFVFTHLKNLMNTADPHKQDVAEAVKRLTLNPPEQGGIKASRCFESSTLLNRLNLGYVADADVTWSKSAFIPRSARVNLTMEMFGNSINFFEAGARLDGVELFIEKYFGVDGYFGKGKSKKEDMEGFLYARIFGNELFFKEIQGSKDVNKIKSFINLDEVLISLSKKFDYGYSHSYPLYDGSLIISTLIGMPMNLSINSTASVNTEAKGKVDFSGLLSRSKEIELTSDIIASGGIELTGTMMVDAFFCKQGVRMRNTLYTNLHFKPSIVIKKRQIVDVQIDSSDQPIEIFDARTQFFIIHDNYEKEQEMIKENKEELSRCTGDKFSKVTGLQLCGELSYSNASTKEDAPYFPLTGPARASLVLRKKDTHRNYRFFAKWNKNSKHLEAQLILDTPGSQVDRHVSTELAVGNLDDKHIDFVLHSPWKKLMVNGKAIRNKNLASLTGTVVVDESNQYRLTSEIKMNRKGNRNEYLPFLEIENPSHRTTLLSGSIIHNEGKDFSALLELKDLNKNTYVIENQFINHNNEKKILISTGVKNRKPYKFLMGVSMRLSGKAKVTRFYDPVLEIQTENGVIASLTSHLEHQLKPFKVSGHLKLDTIRMRNAIYTKVNISHMGPNYELKVKQDSDFINGDLTGNVNTKRQSGRIEVNYRTKDHKDHIEWQGKLKTPSKKLLKHLEFNSLMTFQNMPKYNTKTHLKVIQKKGNHFELTMKYGKNLKKKNLDKVIRVTGFVDSDLNKVKNGKIKAALRTEVLEKNVDINIKLDHSHSLRKIDYDVRLHLAPFVKDDINAAIVIQDRSKAMMAITRKGNLELMGKKYEVESDLTQKSKRRYDHSLIASSSDSNKNHKITSVVKMNGKTHEITTDIESPGLEKPVKLFMSASVNSYFNVHVKGNWKEDNKEVYAVDALSKLNKATGKLKLNIIHPSRKVISSFGIHAARNSIHADALVNWDATSRQKRSKEIIVNFVHIKRRGKNYQAMKSNVKISTPFKNYEKLSSNININHKDSELKTLGKISWGGIHKQITSDMTVKLPVSYKQVNLNFKAATPFRQLKDINIEIDHAMNPEILTILKGKLNKEESQLKIVGQKDAIENSQSLNGELHLKTPYKTARRISLVMKHVDNRNELTSDSEMNWNQDSYKANVKLLKNPYHPKSEKSIDISVSSPLGKLESKSTYRKQDGKHEITSTVSNTHRRKNVVLNIAGHVLDHNDFALDVKVTTLAKLMKFVGFEIQHILNEEKLVSKIIITKNHAKMGHDIKLTKKQMQVSAEVLLLLSPLYENDVRLTSHTHYDAYPVTTSTEISWSPRDVITFSSSHRTETTDDVEAHVKLTTPFEGYENINLLASQTLKDESRESHLIIDYNLRKVVDMKISRQNDEKIKNAKVKLSLNHSQFKSLDTGFEIDMRNGMDSKIHMKLLLRPKDTYESKLNLKMSRTAFEKGEIIVKTPLKDFEKIEGSISQDKSKNVITHSLILNKNEENLAHVTIRVEGKTHKQNIKVTTKGKILYKLAGQFDKLVIVVSQLPDMFSAGILHFAIFENLHEFSLIPKMQSNEKGNILKELVSELNIEKKHAKVDLDGSLTVDYGNSKKQCSFNVLKEGNNMDNLNLESSITMNKQTLKGKLCLQFVDDILIQAILSSNQPKDRIGFEIRHSGDLKKLNSIGKIFVSEKEAFEGEIDFFIDNIEHVELTLTSKTPLRGYKLTSLRYRHEGQDNRASCSLNLEDEDGTVGSIDMTAQSSPNHLFSLIVKAPFKDYKNMVVTGGYDEAQVNALITWNENAIISISGEHDNFQNPQVTLKTPMKHLQVLTVGMSGKLSDGSSNFVLKFNDADQVDGKVIVRYQDLSQMMVSAGFNSRIQEVENKLRMEIDAADTPIKSVTHFLLALNDENKIKVDTERDLQQVSGQKLDIELNYPALELQTQKLVFALNGDNEKASGSIQIMDTSETVFDADMNFDTIIDKKGTIFVRKPKLMEYRFTKQSSTEADKNEFYINWDRNDPDANLIVSATVMDKPFFSKSRMEKGIIFKITCPRRSIGFSHDVVASTGTLESSGSVFWNDDSDSKIGYKFHVYDMSNRREKVKKVGALQIQLPTRTLEVSGSRRETYNEHQLESIFSWDKDNDPSRKIGVKGTLMKGTHTDAQVSITLPKDARVESRIIVNKGSTILEGQTEIIYSEDSAKTLTLFSKLKNNHAGNYFFSDKTSNYSIQLGLRHPDSRINVMMDSHLGFDADRLTTSLGLDYMTSRRQTHNLVLFGEINKLKREINLSAMSPYKNIDYTSAIISQNPLEMKSITTVNGQEHWKTHILMDADERKMTIDVANFDRGMIFSAHFPSDRVLQFDIDRHEYDQIMQKNTATVELVSPKIIQTSLDWTPGSIVAVRDMLFDNIKQGTTELKEFVDEVAEDLEKEFTQKYKDTTSSLYDDVKSGIEYTQQEVESIENDVDQLTASLQRNIDFCGLKIAGVDLDEKLSDFKETVVSYVKDMSKSLKSTTKDVHKVLDVWRENLENIRNYPVSEAYGQFVDRIGKMENELFDTFFWEVGRFINSIKEKDFEKFWNWLEEAIEKEFDPQPLIDELNEKMEKVMNRRMVAILAQKSEIASKVRDVIVAIKKMIEDHPATKEILEVVEEQLGGIHPKVKWAYNYWDLEKTLPHKVDELSTLLSEVIADELREQIGSIDGFIANPITHFDSKNGSLQARFRLPIALERLTELPDLRDALRMYVDYSFRF